MAIGSSFLNNYLQRNNITYEQYLLSPYGKSEIAKIEKTKKKIKEYKKNHFQKNKYRATSQQLVRKYGITSNEKEQMIKDQNNKCKICGIEFDVLDRAKIHIDHDHQTKKVRGILCTNCNLGLGMFKDNVDFLLNAVSYLKDQEI